MSRHPKKYFRLLLGSLLMITLLVVILRYPKKLYSYSQEPEDSLFIPNLEDYVETDVDQEIEEPSQPSKQLLSFNDILGKPSTDEDTTKHHFTKKMNKNLLYLIASTNISEPHKDQLKQCYIYFQALPDNIFENVKLLKFIFGVENSELYETMTYFIRTYEHCKELDYSNFGIDYDNQDVYSNLGENTESEMFRYKLVWNYILNNFFDFGLESDVYEFLNPNFINKHINKWVFTESNEINQEKISLARKSERLTDFENLQYILKGDNYLYEYNFNENLVKERQLSYMGKYLSFNIEMSDLFKHETPLYTDFADKMFNDEISNKNNFNNNEDKENVGIILTMGSRHINILPKYLAALNYHIKSNIANENEYHLQLIFNDIEEEFNRNSDTIKTKEQIINEYLKPRISPYSKNFKISILEVGNILNVNRENEENFKFFMNKWISLNFNQFNKFIFTDIDLTLFEHPDQLFSLKNEITKLHDSKSDLANLFSKYKPLNVQKPLPMILLPDRALKERASSQCIQLFKNMLPTTKQRYDFKTFKSLSVPTLDYLNRINPTVSKVFNNIFDIDVRKLHNVDSSLVIINNYNDVSSPLMFSALLNFIGLDKCVYGDKEFLLLGMVYLGRFDFNILGLNTGFVAAKDKIDNVACSTQSAQVYNGKLLSINGGLRKCKIDPVSYAIEKDLELENKAEWLKAYYSISDLDRLREELEIDYMRQIDIDIIVEPNPSFEFELKKDYLDKDNENNYWMRSAFCMEYGYCLDLEEEKSESRYIVKSLDVDVVEEYKNILDLWNKN
ncbi:hypothetical protein ACO0SA_004874 [Hanseniaspora valbyensis]